MGTRTYTTVPGFFVQDNAGQSSTAKGILPRFGLIDDRTDRWTTFVAEIDKLNATAEPGVRFKVFFLGRHGQGYHNVGETKYDIKAWVEYWVKLNGDHEMTWGPDSRLTLLGEQQAQEAHAAWKKERQFGIPLPEKLYTSPLTRAIRTHQVTFDGTLLPSGPKAIIVENMRERNGVHTYDKRRTRSEIQAAFPAYDFEEGFTESDELWTSVYRETFGDVDRRARHVLDVIFHNDREQFISITAHCVFIASFLRVCHRRPWDLPTGGVLPVVVKGSITMEQRN
ncbi:Histidine phosphatase superfamily [Tylopilus felleus]